MVVATNNSDGPPPAKRVWSAYLTNKEYLPGFLTLVYSFRKHKSQYPFVLLYTDELDEESHQIIDKLGIYKVWLPTLVPEKRPNFDEHGDARFHETWSVIQVFGLTQFERIAVLDCDMVLLDNMDELLSDDTQLNLTEDLPLAACHACACNPYNKPHYPACWIPENCAYTRCTNTDPDGLLGPPSTFGLRMINSGLMVVRPSQKMADRCLEIFNSPKAHTYSFPDQELISDAADGKWIGLNFKYNALKTLRNIHKPVWKDDSLVKNIHYISSPKPWQATEDFQDDTHTFHYWNKLTKERLSIEQHVGFGWNS